jgi:hypothetical protein
MNAATVGTASDVMDRHMRLRFAASCTARHTRPGPPAFAHRTPAPARRLVGPSRKSCRSADRVAGLLERLTGRPAPFGRRSRR